MQMSRNSLLKPRGTQFLKTLKSDTILSGSFKPHKSKILVILTKITYRYALLILPQYIPESISLLCSIICIFLLPRNALLK